MRSILIGLLIAAGILGAQFLFAVLLGRALKRASAHYPPVEPEPPVDLSSWNPSRETADVGAMTPETNRLIQYHRFHGTLC